MSNVVTVIQGVLDEVLEERIRQDAKWGEQNHPNGTSVSKFTEVANQMKAVCDAAHKDGTLTWAMILFEEFYEAMAEEDPSALRKELVQTIAVGTGWVEAIDRAELKRKGGV